MNAISKTAYLCCGIRMKDAASKQPLCNDIYAEEFMTEEGKSVFEKFEGFIRPNVSNAVRSRIIEDEIRRRIKKNKDLQIINIGAGFDTRPYRIAGGVWFEIDEPQIIELKNRQLSIQRCANPLIRIPVEFKENQLNMALDQCDTRKETLIVIEGVFMYLEKNQIIELLQLLMQKFPHHTLLCDLMDEVFFHKHMQKMHARIIEIGSQFKLVEKSPRDIFISQGYSASAPISIVGRAVELKGFYVPWLVLNTFLKSLKDGYLIYVFEHGQNSFAKQKMQFA